ncbi:MAG TPA: thiamine biosynthesis protein ThiS [Marinilabiliales bacterium]|nr:thiamine biosynthesis protein ThiS [Marinilabiliales bacterium]
MSKIRVNGKEQEVEVPILLIDLIKKNDVAQPEMVSVQINGEFVDRGDFNSTLVNDNDEVDFLYFMGGGSQKSLPSPSKEGVNETSNLSINK